MSFKEEELMAHLLRRAGFGAQRSEIQRYSEKGYDETVEELLHPRGGCSLSDDLIHRYHPEQGELRVPSSGAAYWLYRMVTTDSPLEEKIALFWHGLFATAFSKVNQVKSLTHQIDKFRKYGLGPFPKLLVELSKDPMMLYWLDNNDNREGAINENYGRELLELFSMGIGTYTEQDVVECSRAFTGWTIQNAEYVTLRASKASIWPYSYIAWQFEYKESDHDYGEKIFLGEVGRFNGEDVIDLIVGQPDTARFICSRLYQFFVADEVEEKGRVLIESLIRSYFESGCEIRSVLRTLFTSSLFKSRAVRLARVKSPAEVVAGTMRLAGTLHWPKYEVFEAAKAVEFMGQELLNPPTVEGWHEGPEWIDSGSTVERVNFASKVLGDINQPGIRDILSKLIEIDGGVLSPERLVDCCLDLIGPLPVKKTTRTALIDSVSPEGSIDLREGTESDYSKQRIAELLKLIAASREFQLA
jgi:uncharacterized protein (DUF1800 family)